MPFRKRRKPRGYKKSGERSYDMCPWCYKPGCDPFGGSARYRQKIEKRLAAGRCPACGKTSCSCKSSVLTPEQFHDREKRRLSLRCSKCVYATTCLHKEKAAECLQYKCNASNDR